jgi:hypothetical protein
VHVAQPGPYLGYGWQVQQELDAREQAARARAAAPYGSHEWRAADAAQAAAECRLARLLDVAPPPPQQLVLEDPWLTRLYAELLAPEGA